jgi:hypothetical protein
MAVTTLIPQVWSASILREFEKASVFGSCLSRLFEGDAKFGNVVKVPSVGSVSVKPYTVRTPITYDDINASTQDIPIDQQSYWAIRVEDIEKIQASPDFLDAATRNAAYGLRDLIDQYVAGILTAGAGITGEITPELPGSGTGITAGVTNSLGTDSEPLEIRSGDVYGLFGLIAQALTMNNVPQINRWMIIPPWLYKKIILARVRRDIPNDALTSDAYIGRFLGFNVLVSNNVVNADEQYNILAGVADCGTLITQINETESLRDPALFGELVRGLAVYTSKVLRPNALAKAVVVEAAELVEDFPGN